MSSNLITQIITAESLLDYGDDADKELKRQYIRDVKTFMFAGSFTEVKNKSYLLKNYMKPIADQAYELDKKPPTIYKNRSRILNDLEARLGRTIIKDILNGDFDKVDKIMLNLKSEQTLTEVVIATVVDHVRKSSAGIRNSDSTFDLIECVDEMRFMKKYSVLDLEILLSRLDPKKLNYLVRLINFEESNVEDRIKLLEFIKD